MVGAAHFETRLFSYLGAPWTGPHTLRCSEKSWCGYHRPEATIRELPGTWTDSFLGTWLIKKNQSPGGGLGWPHFESVFLLEIYTWDLITQIQPIVHYNLQWRTAWQQERQGSPTKPWKDLCLTRVTLIKTFCWLISTMQKMIFFTICSRLGRPFGVGSWERKSHRACS